MVSILWFVVVVLLLLWLLGAFVVHVGDLVHLLLILVIIVVIYNLFAARRAP